MFGLLRIAVLYITAYEFIFFRSLERMGSFINMNTKYFHPN